MFVKPSISDGLRNGERKSGNQVFLNHLTVESVLARSAIQNDTATRKTDENTDRAEMNK